MEERQLARCSEASRKGMLLCIRNWGDFFDYLSIPARAPFELCTRYHTILYRRITLQLPIEGGEAERVEESCLTE